jgi:peptidoglycan/LPS O-acetylase OafA/YrhL
MKRQFFTPIVGLRAYLALWVALGHALQLAGFSKRNGALVAFLLRGDAAVSVFIVVSGFVITNLLLSKNEAYGPYIVRRFFRLYPAYVICCLAGFLVMPLWGDVVNHVPWTEAPEWGDYRKLVGEIVVATRDRFWPNALLHVTMLHGAVPAQVVNRAAMAFLPAAWSISLEWQFYLLAPLVLSCLGVPSRWLALFLVAAAFYGAARKGWLGTYDPESTILLQSGHFAVGIASRLAFDRLSTALKAPATTFAGVAVCALMLLKDPLPVMIWAAFYGLLLEAHRQSTATTIYSRLTTNKVAVALGDASYSLYLLHRPLQVILVAVALHRWPLTHVGVFLLELAGTALAIGLSLAMYTYVEKPGQRLGQRLADAWARSVAPAGVTAAQ